jgi:cytosine/adenosine deaminase-related metal-dependent hydrolase
MENVRSTKTEGPLAVQARWVLPIDQPPIERGIVTIAAGKIVAVGENVSGRPPRDLGDVALLPGLVNAHTHLEFSLLDKPLGEPGMSFPQWIGRVVEYRRAQAKALMVETDGFQRFRRRAAERGLAELTAGASVAVGEIATPGWPRECFPAAGLHVTLFLELLGLEASQQESLLKMAKSFVNDVQDAGAGLRPGISPHAPYTASPDLVRKVCELSAQERFPVAMHLAESLAEIELLASQSGPLVEQLQSMKAWHPGAIPRGIQPRNYLELLASAHRALVIHGNFLADSDWQLLASHRDRMSVVYCPRTHAYFRHGRYPLAEMLAAGVRVAIGTDSLATNPDLSLLAELRHIAREHPAVPPEEVLNLGTLAGAKALGLAERLGSIAPGKEASLVVASPENAADPWSLLTSETRPAVSSLSSRLAS